MSGHVVAAPVDRHQSSIVGRVAHGRYVPVTFAIVAIWLAVLLSSIYAPDMVTGSTHEHLAIAALGDWMWGGMATALLLLAAAFTRPERGDVWPAVAVMVAVIWFVVAVASVFTPTFVTGTDPTTIPIIAMLAPIAGLVATSFLAVFAAGAGARPVD